MENEFNKKLDELGAKIDAKIQEAVKLAETSAAEKGEQIANERKHELEKLFKDYEKVNKERLEATEKRLDEFETNQKKNFSFKERMESMGLKTYKAFKDADLKQFGAGERRSKLITIDGTISDLTRKADMTSAANWTGDVVPPDFVEGIFFDPEEANRVRAFIPVVGTSSSSIVYNEETSFTDNTDTVAEGSASGQSESDVEAKTVAVKKIAAHVTVTEEMLEDLPGFMSYLNVRLSRKLKVKEDTQLLYGDSTGNNLTGLTINATAYSDAIEDSNVQEWDVLAHAIKQLRQDNYLPNVIMVDPGKYNDLMLVKDSDGRYINDWIFSPRSLNVLGVPIVQSNSVTAGDFIVGDLASAARIHDRKQLTFEMTNSHDTEFIADKITIKLSERLALVNQLPSAVIYGQFAEALAQGSA